MSKAAILLYHRVASPASDRWRMAVSPERFAEQVEVVAARFAPLRLKELVRRLARDDVPEGAVAISFDDGYRDVLLSAKPQLELRGVPATVFTVSGYVDSGRDFWWDVLEQLAPSLPEGYDAWHARLQAFSERERNAALDELTASQPAAEPDTLSADELRLLAEGGLVEIGAHTVTHPALTQLTADEQLVEMRSSKERLEELVGASVGGFSYPYGIHDAGTAARARAVGFAYACTSERRPVTGGDDTFALPRLHVDDVSGDAFEERLRAALG
jgi:peptidoglycan/xylan/chitin deacetylase (PgdA/CDA1 family)